MNGRVKAFHTCVTFLRACLMVLGVVLTSLTFSMGPARFERLAAARAGRSEPAQGATKKAANPSGKASKPGALGHADPIQTARNLGKAYYEQGKYAEAIAEFRVVARGRRTMAADHLDLGLALMQASDQPNNLDAALG